MILSYLIFVRFDYFWISFIFEVSSHAETAQIARPCAVFLSVQQCSIHSHAVNYSVLFSFALIAFIVLCNVYCNICRTFVGSNKSDIVTGQLITMHATTLFRICSEFNVFKKVARCAPKTCWCRIYNSFVTANKNALSFGYRRLLKKSTHVEEKRVYCNFVDFIFFFNCHE